MKLTLKKILTISAGNFIYALAVAFFVLPNDLMTGGTTGLGLFFNAAFGIPLSWFVLLFNSAMFILGAFMFGKMFALTTVLSTFEYPIFLSICQVAAAYTGPLTQDKLLAVVFAAIGIGAGIGVVVQAGASTGGMDIPPLVLQKKTGISMSITLYLFDFAILLLQIILADKEQILYGVLLVILYTIILEKMLIYGKRQIQLKIISPKYDEINTMIQTKLDRGTTLILSEGGYRKLPSKAVLTVVSPRELFRLQELIGEIDPDAFITINEVREVRGRGFSMQKVYGVRP